MQLKAKSKNIQNHPRYKHGKSEVKSQLFTELKISNFKSIKHLQLKTERINLFIGEPNAGKSNILETLGLCGAWGTGFSNLRDFVRFGNITNLFYDDLTENAANIITEHFSLQLIYEFDRLIIQEKESESKAEISYDGRYLDGYTVGEFNKIILPKLKTIKFYRFIQNRTDFPSSITSHLLPPDGANLFSIVYATKENRELMQQIVKDFGFQIVFKPQTKTFEIQKQINDIIISYPYVLTSDTLKHIVMYLFAIQSNKESTLVFEEPEGHVFPYYTRFLAEKIALDVQNQYFIATHNPYFLRAILEKAPKESVQVFVTYFENYETKVKKLPLKDIISILEEEKDPFFNIRSYY